MKYFKKIFYSFLFFILPAYSTEAQPSVREMLAQLLLCHFPGAEYNKYAEHLIKNLKIGGVIFYGWANPFQNPEEVKNLTTKLQQESETPLFIAVDQEGEPVVRLRKGYSTIPSALSLSLAPDLIQSVSRQVAHELAFSGININLAPIVDIRSELINCAINTRSFGNTQDHVINCVKDWLSGVSDYKILSTLKHFPGHGQLMIDTHEGLAVTSISSKAFMDQMSVFHQLADKAQVIMTAHIMVRELDNKWPLTLSKTALPALKKDFPEDTLWMSDSLAMRAISDRVPDIAESVILTILAGHDLVMLGGKQLFEHQGNLEFSLKDIEYAIEKVSQEATKNEELYDRIKESYKKIIRIKREIFAYSDEILNLSNEHAKECAYRNLKIHPLGGNYPQQIDSIIAPALLKPILEEVLKQPIIYFTSSNPSREEIELLLKNTSSQSNLLVFSFDEKRFSNQQILISKLAAKARSVALIQTKIPSKNFDCNILIQTMSPDEVAIRHAIETLKEKFNCQI